MITDIAVLGNLKLLTVAFVRRMIFLKPLYRV